MKIPWLKSKSLKLKNPHLYKTQPAAGKNDENDIYLRPLAIIETGAYGQAHTCSNGWSVGFQGQLLT